jgi:hypothetical protein
LLGWQICKQGISTPEQGKPLAHHENHVTPKIEIGAPRGGPLRLIEDFQNGCALQDVTFIKAFTYEKSIS